LAKLLLIEPHASGHRAVYAARLVRAAIARGDTVALATLESSASHPLFQALAVEAAEQFRLIGMAVAKRAPANSVPGRIRAEFAYHRLFARMYRECLQHFRPDCVLVCYLDYCANAIALLGSPFADVPWAGITMRQSFHHADMGVVTPANATHGIKKRLFLRLLGQRTLLAVFTIDPTLPEWLARAAPEKLTKLTFVPDPAELSGELTHTEARSRFGIGRDAVVILVYGSIDTRKGIDVLFHAMTRIDGDHDIHVLLAGVQTDRAVRCLDTEAGRTLLRAGRLHQCNEFLSGTDEYAAFKAADIVWLGYLEHYGMSGVMVQAGHMALPVIACNTGLIGWITAKSDCGIVVDTGAVAELSSSLQQLAADRALRERYGRNARTSFASHTINNFTDRILDTLVAPRQSQRS